MSEGPGKTHVRSRLELDALPVSAAITARGKELAATQPVGAARRLLARASMQVVPVLAGRTFVGAVSRECPRTSDRSIDERIP